MSLGDYAGGFIDEVYVFTNLDSIKLYKNDVLINTFFPDSKTYPYLKHPPVIIKDFVGDTIEKQENISHRDAENIKKIIKYVAKKWNKITT